MTADDRASSGIAPLDDILAGGFVAHRIYLIEGTPGTGKTTLGLLNAMPEERHLILQVGQPLTEFQGIMTGVPSYDGPRPMLKVRDDAE